MTENRQRPVCCACGRKVRPGIACRQASCAWERAPGRLGLVLARPLKARWRI